MQVAIAHSVDIVAPFGEEPGQTYNYLDYFFASSNGPIMARAYADDFNVVLVDVDSSEPLDPNILSYLGERFQEILVQGSEGYVSLSEVQVTETQQ